MATPTSNPPTVPLRRKMSAGMTVPIEKPKDAKTALKRLLTYFSRFIPLLVALVGAVLAVTATSLISPTLIEQAINAITEQRWSGFHIIILELALVYALHVLFSLVQTLTAAHLSQRIVRLMRYDLFRKIDNLPIPYLDRHSSGDVMSRMTNDVENISSTISQSLGALISGVLTVIGTIAIMFFKCWQLTLITMITVLLTLFITKFMSKKMRDVYRRRSQILGQLNGHAEEMITGHRSIVAYNRQNTIKEEFSDLSDKLTKESLKAETLSSSLGPIMDCLSNLSFIIVAACGGYFAYTGLIKIGTISAFILYAKQFSRPLSEIAQQFGTIQTAIAGAERVFDLMDQPDEDNSGSEVIDDPKGNISFRHVNFSYLPGKQVLYDFDLDIKAGQKIALVGATGSGKTTVVNLLMRFYPVDSGEILIDGHNIMDLQRDWLRQNTAIVLQDTVLFSDTIGNNIKYSDPTATDEQMIAAAKMSNSYSFISRLPKKFQTYLKQAGASLSHGQRQLLNISRAVLADPRILILDEATSSIDTRTEQKIQDAMVKLMQNRTSLIIAHRLSTIQDADMIVVMDKGRVVETGNHESLLKKQGYYYSLYMTQFAGKET